MNQTYYYVAGSRAFFSSEPLDEVLEERTRNYRERDKPVDFAYVERPAFLSLPDMATVSDRIEQPAAAVISTDPAFIRWLKLRLEYVEMGQFEAPSESLPDPMASLSA